jgi:hypothetical protein
MATTSARLQNLSLEWQVQDTPAVIADLVKSSGMLQTALVAPANWGNKHKYKVWNALPAGSFRSFGTGIVPVSLSKDMNSIDLWEVSTLMQGDCGEVDAHPGGMEGWFNANISGVLAGLGQTITKQLIYGTSSFGSTSGFVGLHQYCTQNSTATALDSDDGGTGYWSSIFVVRWDADTGASVRIYPNANGQLITTEYLGKQTVVTSTTTNAQQPVYSWYVKAFMTLVIPSATSVYAIREIGNGTNSTDTPTASNMDYAIDYVMQGGAGNIVIYPNLYGLAALRALKTSKIGTSYSEAINTNVPTWNGVPIALDTNLSAVETTALYATTIV